MRIFKAGNIKFPLNKTYIMGILNITPDSFSDGGDYFDRDSAVLKAQMLEKDGADILDIGAQSTRPGSKIISADEELARILPVINALKNKSELPISVDTFYPVVAEKCLECGAVIINDVSGKINEEMLCVVKKYNAGYIVMHNEKIVDPIAKVLYYLATSCTEFGIPKERVMIDPGIGFEKSTDENIEIIRNMKDFKKLDFPLLMGASRKRFIGAVCKINDPKDRDAGTLATSVIFVAGGANFIRVHEVKNTKQAILMADKIYCAEA